MADQQFMFKAWVESYSEKGGKLHVHGEVMVVDPSLMYELGKKDQETYFPDELYLEIKPEPVPGKEKVEIKYHEELADGKQYKKITIFARNEQVYEISEVETR